MQWDDDHVDRMIGTLLRVGVLFAAGIVLVSGIWFLTRSGSEVPDYRTFRGEPERFSTITGILVGVWHRHPRSAIQFGLLVLIATPVLRVAFSVLAFSLQRDRLYAGITLLVLVVLLGSLSGFVHPPH